MRRFSRILWLFHAIVSFLEKRFQPGGLYADIYRNPAVLFDFFLEELPKSFLISPQI
jgi:hypothetical protein